MSYFVRLFAMALAIALLPSPTMAEIKTLSINAFYRERIALPQNAELYVELVGTSRMGAGNKNIASQRFAMVNVPMTVALSYDPRVLDETYRYSVIASIWSAGTSLFRTTKPLDIIGQPNGVSVDLLLTMVSDENDNIANGRSIAGIEWAVTEISGLPWPNDDPATLIFDTESNVSAFGGCNRFRGKAVTSDGALAFHGDFAGTLMACPDPLEDLERRFLNALRQVAGYVRYGAGLLLTDAQGNAVMHLVQRPE